MPSHRQKHFRRGDLVVVRSSDEILATLDADGTLDGMPFMPEMVESCGQRRRVARRIEKTCVEGDPKIERMFWSRDVVALEDERCSGAAHAHRL